jgi:tRNA U34 5-methylaminomethyl-2-thiouridine-forming methyltransferase MnmC
MNPEIILTRDGSHSLMHPVLKEPYHSRHGALSESLHVYIQSGLRPLLKQNPTEIKILEVGLGTGLNTWLTLCEAQQIPTIQFEMQALEPFPLSWDLVSQLNIFGTPEGMKSAHQLHDAPWETTVPLLPNFLIAKTAASLQTAGLPPNHFHLVYHDAFSGQPEMWQPDLLAKLYAALRPGGVWVTYCAKGRLKRDLRAVGFAVEALPGPPGKREMLRAVR